MKQPATGTDLSRIALSVTALLCLIIPSASLGYATPPVPTSVDCSAVLCLRPDCDNPLPPPPGDCCSLCPEPPTIDCSAVLCARPPCPNPFTPRGQCCPICPEPPTIDCRLVLCGVRPDCDRPLARQCCPICSEPPTIDCRLVLCAQPDCDHPLPPLPGQCCPICPEPPTIDCRLVRCARPPCPNPLPAPKGKCCPICPPTTRPPPPAGCPVIPPGQVGICVDLCSSDDDCDEGVLCCSNGCGHVCSGSQPTPPSPETCTFNGKTFNVGDSFPAGDGCNRCSCLRGGRVVCTLIACSQPPPTTPPPDTCTFNGKTFNVGDTFPAGDGCNTCTCSIGGLVACTRIGCPTPFPPICKFKGQKFKVGESFPAGDGCNRCTCIAANRVVCTEIACDPCALVDCAPGFACKVFKPTGEAFCEPSCDLQNGGCPRDRKCTLVDVVCVRAPCPPIVECVDPCKKFPCPTGSVCEVFVGPPFGVEPFCNPSCDLDNGGCPKDKKCRLNQVFCIRAPCPPVVECIDPCKGFNCPSGSKCEVFVGPPFGQEAFCQPSCDLDNGGCPANKICRLETVVCVRSPCPPRAVCLDPSEVCVLRANPGPCDAVVKSFFFNSVTGQCEKFTYGGCGGNFNRFSSLQSCKAACSTCKLPSDTGPCRAHFRRYFFNLSTKQCESFVYGGCKGNANRFSSLTACVNACGVPCPLKGQVFQECASCPATCDDPNIFCRAVCQPGCGCPAGQLIDTANKRCVKPKKCPNRCSLPKDAGPCEALIPSYYHNSATRQCEQFNYGGCGGNGNRFSTLSECIRKCKPRGQCPPVCSADLCKKNKFALCSMPGPREIPGCTGQCQLTFCSACYFSNMTRTTPTFCRDCGAPVLNLRCLKHWAFCLRRVNIWKYGRTPQNLQTQENFKCFRYPCPLRG